MAYKSKFTGKQIDDYLDSIGTKQDKLVDGVNIATINGQSLTNGGDVTIEAGSIISESDIAAMGFTKNTGTYSKPTDGIPAADLESDVQNKLNKVDSLNAGMEDTDETVEDVVSLPFVSYNEQSLTEEQKEQARVNIGIVVQEDNHFGTRTPGNGIYIKDTDGYFHVYSGWDGTYLPVGIAVITDNHSFLIALQDAYSNTTYFCDFYPVLIDGITTTTDYNTAITDYNGESQTNTMINALGTSALAANYCRNYIFPDFTVGYLGSVGEWKIVIDNLYNINLSLNACGYSSMTEYYWSSTQYKENKMWGAQLDPDAIWGYDSRYYQGDKIYVRAFGPLNI